MSGRSTKRLKGLCRVCGKVVALDDDGKVRMHGQNMLYGVRMGDGCRGFGKFPECVGHRPMQHRDIDPLWSVTRVEDVVVSWACEPHLSTVCLDLQRDHEVTELVVKHYAKSAEIAEINRMILAEMPGSEGKR